MPSRAGDIVLFHFRIDHRGTAARAPQPPGYRKMAVFIPASANNEHVQRYRAWQDSRVDYLWLKGGHDWDAELRASLSRHGLRLG